jgi:hypothetical protein
MRDVMGIRDRADEPLKSCGASYTSIVCTENLNASILVMKSAKDTARCYDTHPLNRARNWRVLVQKSMRSDTIVQHDDGTPTGSRRTSFFIRGILGPDA